MTPATQIKANEIIAIAEYAARELDRIYENAAGRGMKVIPEVETSLDALRHHSHLDALFRKNAREGARFVKEHAIYLAAAFDALTQNPAFKEALKNTATDRNEYGLPEVITARLMLGGMVDQPAMHSLEAVLNDSGLPTKMAQAFLSMENNGAMLLQRCNRVLGGTAPTPYSKPERQVTLVEITDELNEFFHAQMYTDTKKAMTRQHIGYLLHEGMAKIEHSFGIQSDRTIVAAVLRNVYIEQFGEDVKAQFGELAKPQRVNGRGG